MYIHSLSVYFEFKSFDERLIRCAKDLSSIAVPHKHGNPNLGRNKFIPTQKQYKMRIQITGVSM